MTMKKINNNLILALILSLPLLLGGITSNVPSEVKALTEESPSLNEGIETIYTKEVEDDSKTSNAIASSEATELSEEEQSIFELTKGTDTEGNSFWTITGLKEDISGDIVIPQTIDDVPVTRIGNYAFSSTSITGITIPNGITSIGNGAFEICESLVSVSLPDTITALSDSVFRCCSSLTSVLIPSSVTSIGNNAFERCTSLTSIDIPDSVITLARKAFYYCTSLTDVTVGNGVTSIEEQVFYNCSSLAMVSFNENTQVSSIGEYAFACCYSLTYFYIPVSVTSIGIHAFWICPKLTSFSFGGTMSEWEKIGYDYETKMVSCLDGTIYPDDYKLTVDGITYAYIKSGSSWAVSDCDDSLTEVTIAAEISGYPVTTINSYSLVTASIVNIPTSITYIGWGSFGEEYTINYLGTKEEWESLASTSAASYFIAHCVDGIYIGTYVYKDIDEVRYSASSTHDSWTVTSKYSSNNYTVYEVTILSTIEGLPVLSIGDSAFSYYRSLSSVTIMADSQLTSIGSQAFYNRTAVSIATIPTTLTSIASNAFYSCKRLEYAGTLEEWNALGTSFGISVLVCSDASEVSSGSEYSYKGANYSYITNYWEDGINYGDGWKLLSIDEGVSEIVIPSELLYHPVLDMNNNIFLNNTALESLTIGPAKLLTEVLAKNGLAGCTNLKEVNCDETNIYAMEQGCLIKRSENQLALYFEGGTIPSYVTSIGSYAFSNSQVVTVDSSLIPSSVTMIDSYAFYGASELTSVEIPSSIKSIGRYAFSTCSNLSSLTFEENGKLMAIRDYSFSATAISSLSLPSGLKVVSSYAFNNCSSLSTINVPSSLVSIGSNAFIDCENIIYEGSKAKWERFYGSANWVVTCSDGDYYADGYKCRINENVYKCVKNNYYGNSTYYWHPTLVNSLNATLEETIYGGAVEIRKGNELICGEYTYSFKEGGWSLIEAEEDIVNALIPDTVLSYPIKQIGEAFSRHTSLVTVTIPDSVLVIDSYAFYLCSSLTTVNLSENSQLAGINELAFYDCSSLSSLNLPDTVFFIGQNVFGGNNSLDPLVVPHSVTNMEEYCFSGCKSLAYEGTVAEWKSLGGSEVYSGLVTCSDGVTIGNNMTYTENGINYRYSSSSSSWAVIGLSDSSITELTILDTIYGASVTSIADSAFRYDTSIISVTIPNTVTSIGSSAFYNCSSLSSITIPNSVTSIGYYAFRGCSSLSNVTIPISVTSIGEDAFSGCDLLTYEGTVEEWIAIGGAEAGSDDPVTCSDGYYLGDGTYYSENGITYTYSSSSFSWKVSNFDDSSSITEIVIPSEVLGAPVTSIGGSAFYGSTSLVSVTIPDTVTSIARYAFYDCESLSSITIPSSVTTIGYFAFLYCSSLASVIFENPVGWKAGSTALSETDLSDDATAASYLINDYAGSDWTRS